MNEKKQVHACWRMIRISPQKLGVVVSCLRGHSLGRAIKILDGMKKSIAPGIKKFLLSAKSNAVNNFQLNPDSLRVSEISVGKNMVLRRRHIGGRSHSGEIRKPFSQIRVVLEEK
ncbi:MULTISPECIES: large ribosomal subunit protein uL22 [Holospora]|uniref:50S ribosomal protein L22 n=2 Tax=Holospora TaxID=44747 RepID=A0A061JHH9_9PROT|nr:MULTISPECIES: uL22 family ribosomal protein [Holospora]ETZ04758.1 50S ribosomal protein L22 [Holospora undulata HU1]GAJ46022.1 50S ribosomal protein L22 [Holospora elegans E1]